MEASSFEAYTKALNNFKATVGRNALGSGEIYLKLAEYHAGQSQPEAAGYVNKVIETSDEC